MQPKTLNPSLKILAIGFGDSRTPSTRYRLLQFIEEFKLEGVKVEFVSSTNFKSWSSISKYIFEQKTDVIWIQKKLFPVRWVWRIAHRYKIVFDFDDAIWTSQRTDRSRFTQWRSKWKLNFILKKSSLVLAGNQFLADYASRYSDRVVVVPTVVDTKNYPAKIHHDCDTYTLGWIGYSGNFKYLQDLKPVFENLVRLINFKLLVIADKDFEMPSVNVVNRRWSLETEVHDILDMDIGLMPLDDTEWTRGKCSFKAIQYMAAGIPAVASNVGANTELISSGRNGFLATTEEDWLQSIIKLSTSASLRSAMGHAARQAIIERYSLAVTSDRLLSVFQNLNGK